MLLRLFALLWKKKKILANRPFAKGRGKKTLGKQTPVHRILRGDDNEGKRDKFWGPSRPASLLINMIYASKKKIVIAIEFFFFEKWRRKVRKFSFKARRSLFFFLFAAFCEGKIKVFRKLSFGCFLLLLILPWQRSKNTARRIMTRF